MLILFSIIIAGILLLDLEEGKSEGIRLYTYPVSVAEKTYIITVRTNWTSAPEVYLPELASNYVSVDFSGSLRANVFFNITVPADLIWGEISLIWKYYEQSDDSYNLSYNSTDYSVQMIFYHTAAVEHFEIRGTEGVIEPQDRFVVTTVTASPSNSTPGLVTVTGEIRNNGAQNETVLVIMQIKEPNGDIMSIENNSLLLEIPAGETGNVEFEPRIPLNVKIGIFNVQLEVYNLNQTINYCSTGFVYPFTTPIRYHIYPDLGPKGFDFMMTVDGKTYYEGAVFYWYLGEAHTIIVPHIVMVNDVYGWIFDGWGGPDGNVLELTVTADHPTDIEISYGLYYP